MKKMGGEHVTIITCCAEYEPLPLIQSLLMTQQMPDHIVVVDYQGNDHRRKRISEHFSGWTYAMPAESYNLARGETLGGRLAMPKGWWCFVNPRLMFPPGWFAAAHDTRRHCDPILVISNAAVSKEEPKDQSDLKRISETSRQITNSAGLMMVKASAAIDTGGFDDEAERAEAASASMGNDYMTRLDYTQGSHEGVCLSENCVLPEEWTRASFRDDPVLAAKAKLRAEGHDLQYPPFTRDAIGPCNRVWSSDTTVPLPSENAQW